MRPRFISALPPAALLAAALIASPAVAQESERAITPEPVWSWDPTDPRIGLKPGVTDAGEAARGVRLLSNTPLAPEFGAAAGVSGAWIANSDFAFQGDLVFMGNFGGFNVYDYSDPTAPEPVVSVVCPGGQGDLSVHGNLLFMSVETMDGRIDCGTQGTSGPVDPERFRGVRIFDITDIAAPRQVAGVQTCRGSHTHTLVTDPTDPDHVYVYVQGIGPVRPAEELAGCTAEAGSGETALFRIEVIKVPLAAPAEARVVSEPRIFQDYDSGDIQGLWPGGDHGDGTQETSQTDQCHDITVNSSLGLAAGACSGNGILLDISDPVNPVRIAEVSDPNFAYWHSATFNNDGTKVIFTDEWGGGGQARCTPTDRPNWGADAIFTLEDGKLDLAGYYKLPVPQTASENCVAHNGSLIPVPGRDIMAQAWYQGGMSLLDFTDPAHAYEIAFFDRGPLSDTEPVLGGFWSTYWHNGLIFGSAIVRGLDVFELTPSEHLTENEIAAAKLARFTEFNAQSQPRYTWPSSFIVANAYVDQLVRAGAIDEGRAAGLRAAFEQVQSGEGRGKGLRAMDAAADALDAEVRSTPDAGHVNTIRGSLSSLVRELAVSFR
jgi:hypothetical protein